MLAVKPSFYCINFTHPCEKFCSLVTHPRQTLPSDGSPTLWKHHMHGIQISTLMHASSGPRRHARQQTTDKKNDNEIAQVDRYVVRITPSNETRTQKTDTQTEFGASRHTLLHIRGWKYTGLLQCVSKNASSSFPPSPSTRKRQGHSWVEYALQKIQPPPQGEERPKVGSWVHGEVFRVLPLLI